MIIALSGLPGSGKSTVGRMLAERMGYKFYSMGDLRGKMAVDRNMTIDELNDIGKTESWTDREVDEYQKKLGETEDNFVIDGKLSFYFIPHSFKIFLDIDLGEAARRLQTTVRPDEQASTTVEERKKRILKRMENDEARYQKYYGLNFRNRSKFDLVINTTDKTPKAVLDTILASLPKK